MGLIVKLAWAAIPALAGIGVLAQVSSQGQGSPPARGAVALPQYPEDKDFLALAGVRGAERYAQFVNPNLGLTEAELGVSRAQLKQIEANIKAAIIANPIDNVARGIKREKYGINAAETYIAAPEGMSPDDWRKKNLADYNAGRMDTILAVRKELANAEKTPAALNNDIAAYLDGLAQKAVAGFGISNPNKLLAAKAFVLAAHYAVNQAEYKSINYTMGVAQGPMHDARTAKGIYVLDVARGVCFDKEATFNYLIMAKSDQYKISSDLRYINIKGSSSGGYQYEGITYSHTDSVVKFLSAGKHEVYDTTHGLIYDSKDADAAAALAAGAHGFIRQRPYKDPNHKFFRISDGDPVSSLSLRDYLQIPADLGSRARNALPGRAINN